MTSKGLGSVVSGVIVGFAFFSYASSPASLQQYWPEVSVGNPQHNTWSASSNSVGHVIGPELDVHCPKTANLKKTSMKHSFK